MEGDDIDAPHNRTYSQTIFRMCLLSTAPRDHRADTVSLRQGQGRDVLAPNPTKGPRPQTGVLPVCSGGWMTHLPLQPNSHPLLHPGRRNTSDRGRTEPTDDRRQTRTCLCDARRLTQLTRRPPETAGTPLHTLLLMLQPSQGQGAAMGHTRQTRPGHQPPCRCSLTSCPTGSP